MSMNDNFATSMANNIHSHEIHELINTVSALKATLENILRPANEIIYDDVDLRNLLKVSKRTLAYWRERGMITFSKLGGKIYYRLSDVLALLKEYEVQAVSSDLKIAL